MQKVPMDLQLDRESYLKNNPLTPIAILKIVDSRVIVAAEDPLIKKQCEAVYGIKYSIPYLLNTDFISAEFMLALAVDGAHNAYSVSRSEIEAQAKQELETLKMYHQSAMLKLIRGNGIDSIDVAPKAVSVTVTEIAPRSAAERAESKKRKPRVRSAKATETVNTTATAIE